MRLPFVIAWLLIAAATPAAQDQHPSFRATSSELVVLPAVVTDRHGGFIPSLNREQFTIFDNGERREVELFASEDAPVTVGLVIDNSGSMGPKIGDVMIATAAFARLSNPDDELFTIAFNDRVLEAGSRRVTTAADSAALHDAISALRPQGRTALYDALVAALDRLEQGSQARKALVLMSDGGDNASRATLDDVLTRARRSNVTIYAIGLFEDNDEDRNPRVLKSIAESTGGARFLPRSPSLLLKVCSQIARELRSGYTLGFAPPLRDGAFHRIRIEVDLPAGVKGSVRTRPGYFAASSAGRP